MEYFHGLMLGMTLQLSLGPVFFAVFHKAVTAGSKEAFKLTMGVAIIDAAYIGLSFTGIALLLQIELLQMIVLVIGALVLVLFGLRYIQKGRYRLNTTETSGNFETNSENRYDIKLSQSSFTYGLKLTAINPLTVVFWSGTFGALIASGIIENAREAVFYGMGCVSATIVFLGTTSFLVPHIPLPRNTKLEMVFDYFVGLVLIVFGVLMVLRFFKLFL